MSMKISVKQNKCELLCSRHTRRAKGKAVWCKMMFSQLKEMFIREIELKITALQNNACVLPYLYLGHVLPNIYKNTYSYNYVSWQLKLACRKIKFVDNYRHVLIVISNMDMHYTLLPKKREREREREREKERERNWQPLHKEHVNHTYSFADRQMDRQTGLNGKK